jgi:L-alanine-DL-glutamate epimerase-like enolase superfamily enzyme
LKITEIELIPVDMPRKKVLTLARYGNLGSGTPFEFVLVRVHTDEGVTGVGECPPLPPLSPESQPVVMDVLRRWLAPNVIGMDPFETEALWERMDFLAPTYPMAKATIDNALWDIRGRSLDMPVYRLLGGSTPENIPNTGLIGIGEPHEVAEEAERMAKAGYTCLRIKIGPGFDVKCFAAAREAVGDGVTLRVDCNQGYSASDAIKIIRAMEPYGLELVEQPTVWWDFASLAKVARAVDTPIMPHESIYLLSDVKNLLDAGALGVLGLKTYRPWGGLTGARRILEMARVMNVPCLFHDDIELSVSLAAATHIITAYKHVITHKCELSGYPEWIGDDVVKEPVEFHEGYVRVPEGPGFGVEIDEDKLDAYKKDQIKIS